MRDVAADIFNSFGGEEIKPNETVITEGSVSPIPTPNAIKEGLITPVLLAKVLAKLSYRT